MLSFPDNVAFWDTEFPKISKYQSLEFYLWTEFDLVLFFRLILGQ
jgi:hypothetical protein